MCLLTTKLMSINNHGHFRAMKNPHQSRVNTDPAWRGSYLYVQG